MSGDFFETPRNLVLDAFGEGMEALVDLVAAAGNTGVLGVYVSRGLWEAFGVAPDERLYVRTPCGMVRVEPGQDERRVDPLVEALRLALSAALKEIDEHNDEYDHRTPKKKLEEWRKLAAGGPLVDVFARLDVVGLRMRAGESSPSEDMLRAMYAAGEIPNPLHQLIRSTEEIHHASVEVPRWEDDGGVIVGDLAAQFAASG